MLLFCRLCVVFWIRLQDAWDIAPLAPSRTLSCPSCVPHVSYPARHQQPWSSSTQLVPGCVCSNMRTAEVPVASLRPFPDLVATVGVRRFDINSVSDSSATSPTPTVHIVFASPLAPPTNPASDSAGPAAASFPVESREESRLDEHAVISKRIRRNFLPTRQ